MKLKIYAKIRFGHFFVFLALFSVICRPVHLFNTPCGLKVLIKKSGGVVAYFYFGHTSLKRQSIFHWIAIFATTKTVVMSVNKN